MWTVREIAKVSDLNSWRIKLTFLKSGRLKAQGINISVLALLKLKAIGYKTEVQGRAQVGYINLVARCIDSI